MVPELPDVELIRRSIANGALHKRVKRVHVRDERLVKVRPTTLRRHLRGHELGATKRHGKWIVAAIDGDDRALAMHFGMTGGVKLLRDGEVPKHAGLVLDFDDDSSLAIISRRRLGAVDLVDGEKGLVEKRDLGPDALELGPGALRRSLSGRSGTIKGALMDQSTVSGIGNVYADEILFQARIHPKSKVPELDDNDWKRLERQTRDVLERAIGYHANRSEMPDTWLTPHRRDDDPHCPRCGTRLEKAAVSGRPTLWCPRRV